MPLVSVDLPEETIKKIDELKAQRRGLRPQRPKTLTANEQTEATRILHTQGLPTAQKYIDSILKPETIGKSAKSRGGIIRELLEFVLQFTPGAEVKALSAVPEVAVKKSKVTRAKQP